MIGAVRAPCLGICIVGIVVGLFLTLGAASLARAAGTPRHPTDVEQTELYYLTEVKAKIVFVAFPDNTDRSLPVWAEACVDTLKRFVSVMSRGRHTLDLEVLTRPDSVSRAWVAPHPALYYAQMSPDTGYAHLNTEIMQQISGLDSTLWQTARVVFMVHYQCTSCGVTLDADTCEKTKLWGGHVGLLATAKTTGFHFAMTGATLNIWHWPDLQSTTAGNALAWNAAHEYGHLLSIFRHPPGSDVSRSSPEYVNPGHYDLMRAASGVAYTNEGIYPYHPLEIAQAGWAAQRTIVSETHGVRIHDIRGDSANVVEVVAGGSQSFVLANNQGSSSFDGLYGRNGLLIWHKTPVAWDLESAAGKFTNGLPDPVAGKDPLEVIDPDGPDFVGSAEDIWDGVSHTAFSVATNPNTNRYGGSGAYSDPQDVPTSIGIENIRRDAATGDMIVDVYFGPRQHVTHPNGGETLTAGLPDTVRWTVRPYAGIQTVDVDASYDGGATWSAIAAGLANTGAYEWLPAAGTAVRIRLRSHDEAGAVAVDVSDANFTVKPAFPTEPAVTELAIEKVAPVPARHGVDIDCAVPTTSGVRTELGVFDVTGRRVATLREDRTTEGRFRATWNLTTAEGARVKAGIYWLRLAHGADVRARRIVIQ